MASIRDWIDDRTGYRSVLNALLLLNFPVNPAARWRYIWGGSLAVLFLVELVTGTLLMTVYSPSESAAWGSVHYIDTQVSWGWIIRGVHHYTSHMLLVVMLIHTLTVVVTAGYRKPREFTYWSGLILGGLVLALAVTGNPLPWDQKGYWAYQIETGIAGTMPVIGPTIKSLLIGGAEFGNLTLTRLYTLHVIVLPTLAVFLLVIHVALMRREKLLLGKKVDGGSGESLTGMEPYWPYQTTRNLAVAGILLAVVVGQLVFYPQLREKLHPPAPATEWEQDVPMDEITLEAPADAGAAYPARPEWYFRFLFELRGVIDDYNRDLTDEEEPDGDEPDGDDDRISEVWVTAGLPILVVAILFLMPFFDKVLGKWLGYTLAFVLFGGGLGGMLFLTGWGIWKDQNDPEFQQDRRREINYAGRAIWLAGENGIPPEGPGTLLRNDPKAAGPLLFKTHCATCHSWNGHDGTGFVAAAEKDSEKTPMVPTASDLYGFGGRKWIAEFLAKPADPKFFGRMHQLKGGDKLAKGEMVKWAEENLGEEGPLTEEHIQALAALLAAEAQRIDEPPLSEEEQELAANLFSGILEVDGEELEFSYCLQCHDLKSGDPDELGNDGLAPAPDLNGYGSSNWLKGFIRTPGKKKFYGKKNIMPSFDDTQIPNRELDLLVNWMRGEWARAAKPDVAAPKSGQSSDTAAEPATEEDEPNDDSEDGNETEGDPPDSKSDDSGEDGP